MSDSTNNLTVLFEMLRKHLGLLLIPVAVFVASAGAYVATTQPKWRATQAFQIRDEVALHNVIPGRFDSLDVMKMVQETVSETARRQGVVENVLHRVGPPGDYEHPHQWPTILDIENVQNAITLSAPNGAEFGRTELILLSVDAESVERAKRIVGELAVELQKQLNEMRDKRAESIELELTQAVEVARENLEAANLQLLDFEKRVGPLLIELRAIAGNSASGSSGIQDQLATVVVELRTAKEKHQVLVNQLEKLNLAIEYPNQFLAFSGELLAAQPSLRRLKEQLVTIQSATAVTLGKFEEHHPQAQSALQAESKLRSSINEEVRSVAKGVENQVNVTAEQIARLETTRNELEGKIRRLSELRTPYEAEVRNADQKREILDNASRELARVKAIRIAAQTTNLITLLDDPYSGSRPEGNSKKMIFTAAGLAGLLSGLGLVFFAASPSLATPLESGRRERVDDLSDSLHPEWRREALGWDRGESRASSSEVHRQLSGPQTQTTNVDKIDFSEVRVGDDIKQLAQKYNQADRSAPRGRASSRSDSKVVENKAKESGEGGNRKTIESTGRKPKTAPVDSRPKEKKRVQPMEWPERPSGKKGSVSDQSQRRSEVAKQQHEPKQQSDQRFQEEQRRRIAEMLNRKN